MTPFPVSDAHWISDDARVIDVARAESQVTRPPVDPAIEIRADQHTVETDVRLGQILACQFAGRTRAHRISQI